MLQVLAILECRKASESMLCLLVPVATSNVRWCWNTISTSWFEFHDNLYFTCKYDDRVFCFEKKNIWLLFVMHTNVYRYIYTMCVPRHPLQLSGVIPGVNSFFFRGRDQMVHISNVQGDWTSASYPHPHTGSVSGAFAEKLI